MVSYFVEFSNLEFCAKAIPTGVAYFFSPLKHKNTKNAPKY